MASSVQQKRDNVMGEKEKAMMEEGMKDAKNYIMTNNISNNQIQAMAVVSIRSSFGQRMRSYRNHSWIGNFMARLPDYINGGDGAVFVHKGSKGALLYGLERDATPLALGWILSWSKPDTPGEPNRDF
ncbi:uncharacterized protein LOC110703575 isoform X2 [Chenopodium quinoa]|uniref:uncharacterized protein LOC110693078 isoform X2 n=1 Tax=Chenopodium quinoa TaxID=63459 RepID=UPI000B791B86|nr:uncharacterized protein LOC110693078 isoform X2 [Chenopodium quinoa]XP_021737048.1 uncharacterized protein LOC110703575 isoform X2 [Chenopodium quinoa]